MPSSLPLFAASFEAEVSFVSTRNKNVASTFVLEILLIVIAVCINIIRDTEKEKTVIRASDSATFQCSSTQLCSVCLVN